MKSTFLSILISIILTSSVWAQGNDKNVLYQGLKTITTCQATFKIAAYYAGIYYMFKESVENMTTDSSLIEMLKEDWLEAAKISIMLQRSLQPYISNINQDVISLYNDISMGLLINGSDASDDKELRQHVQNLFRLSKDCKTHIETISESLKN